VGGKLARDRSNLSATLIVGALTFAHSSATDQIRNLGPAKWGSEINLQCGNSKLRMTGVGHFRPIQPVLSAG
jgi:hypothetical protein